MLASAPATSPANNIFKCLSESLADAARTEYKAEDPTRVERDSLAAGARYMTQNVMLETSVFNVPSDIRRRTTLPLATNINSRQPLTRAGLNRQREGISKQAEVFSGSASYSDWK